MFRFCNDFPCYLTLFSGLSLWPHIWWKRCTFCISVTENVLVIVEPAFKGASCWSYVCFYGVFYLDLGLVNYQPNLAIPVQRTIFRDSAVTRFCHTAQLILFDYGIVIFDYVPSNILGRRVTNFVSVSVENLVKCVVFWKVFFNHFEELHVYFSFYIYLVGWV